MAAEREKAGCLASLLQIRTRADAAQNGGHITKAEQKQLNQQENAPSGEIYQEKYAGAQ